MRAGPSLLLRCVSACGAQAEPLRRCVRQDVLIYNRDARSTRRLCNLEAVMGALEARGLTHAYAEIPGGACEQVAALAQPYRFIITPHGAHEARMREFQLSRNAWLTPLVTLRLWSRLTSSQWRATRP